MIDLGLCSLVNATLFPARSSSFIFPFPPRTDETWQFTHAISKDRPKLDEPVPVCISVSVGKAGLEGKFWDGPNMFFNILGYVIIHVRSRIRMSQIYSNVCKHMQVFPNISKIPPQIKTIQNTYFILYDIICSSLPFPSGIDLGSCGIMWVWMLFDDGI